MEMKGNEITLLEEKLKGMRVNFTKPSKRNKERNHISSGMRRELSRLCEIITVPDTNLDSFEALNNILFKRR
jgi:hypothetical protein